MNTTVNTNWLYKHVTRFLGEREKERDNRMTMKPTRYFLVKVDNSVYV